MRHRKYKDELEWAAAARAQLAAGTFKQGLKVENALENKSPASA